MFMCLIFVTKSVLSTWLTRNCVTCIPGAETITITPADSRWVGAWWLGYLIAGVITLLSAIPFWFLPRSLPVPGPQFQRKDSDEQKGFIKDHPHMKNKYTADEHTSFIEMAKGKV